MARKPTINLALPETLLLEFNEVCRHYGHGKQKGQVLSAALAMFLAADPREQGRWVKEIHAAEVNDGVQAMLNQIYEQQADEVAKRDRQAATAKPRLSKAAKKRPASPTPVKKLPKPG